MVDLRCTLLMRLSGRLVRGLQSEYLNGVIAETKVDPDSFNFYELMDIIRQMEYKLTNSNGVTEHVTMYYKLPMHDMNDGLVNLTSHYDMLEMFAVHSSGKKYMVIDLYVDCPNVVGSDEDREPEVEVIGRDRNTNADPSSITELGGGLEIGNGQGGGELRGIEHVEEPVVDEEEDGVGNECVNADEDGETVGAEMDKDSESNCEWQPNDDSETSCDSFSGVEESSDEEEEENIALVGLGTYNLETECGEGDSDSDENELVEEGEDGKPAFCEFKDSCMKNPQLIIGMKFPNVRVFRKLLREYHIKEGYTFKFVKNESTRVTVKCAFDCGFRLHASPMYGEKSFQIKNIWQQHTCTRNYTNNNATASWLSNKYLAKLNDAPETKVKSMKNIVRREWLINVSEYKVYRAKRKALEKIRGDHTEQYKKLWDYCETVRRRNPGCRPIIGLDACFLKGPFGGQLMHAVARDGNNQSFPLAFAIVEAKTKYAWTWFMGLLEDLIGNPEEMG
ncbi:uncharacterized protein LOC131329571 [Rhododendron vialii]|uniref:uncharacterized protein LOC131329571 n=1 Tax=Rhododendron vialii TaxID=182163 RepID=UPI00265F5FDE|nr:uncharacterized protein LOC131329571 [Rhododendron vialii]